MRFRKTPPNSVASYAPPSQGPFECANCEYLESANQCNKPEVVREFQLLRGLSKGVNLAPIEAKGCCNYHEKR